MNILSRSLHHCADFDYQGRSSRCELFVFSWFVLAVWVIAIIFWGLLIININQHFNFGIKITAKLPETAEFECDRIIQSQFSSSFKCELPLSNFESRGVAYPEGFRFDNKLFTKIALIGFLVCYIAATTLLCLYSLILICIRRLHDCNSSGLWLIPLIPLPFLLPIFLLILWIIPPSSNNSLSSNNQPVINKPLNSNNNNNQDNKDKLTTKENHQPNLATITTNSTPINQTPRKNPSPLFDSFILLLIALAIFLFIAHVGNALLAIG